MAVLSGRPSPLTSPTAARVASHRYLADAAQETSRTLSARNRQVSLPLVPCVVEVPAFRSLSVTTRTTALLCAAESRRARVWGDRTSAGLSRLPVAFTSHP